MESNGIKSAFPTEILLFKAPINKRHRCSSNDGDCWIKVLNEEAVKKGNMEMYFLRVFTIWTHLSVSFSPTTGALSTRRSMAFGFRSARHAKQQ